MLWVLYHCSQCKWKTLPLLLTQNGSCSSFWLSKHNALAVGVISCIKQFDNSIIEDKRVIPLASFQSVSWVQDVSSPSWGDEGDVKEKCFGVQMKLWVCWVHEDAHNSVTCVVYKCSWLQWSHCTSYSSLGKVWFGGGLYFQLAQAAVLPVTKKPK